MVSKTLLALDSNVESYFNETQPDRNQPGLGARTFVDAPRDEPCLPSLVKQSPGPIQLECIQNDDYEIALVPRKDHTRRTGSIFQPVPTVDRILLLPLTWQELLDRVRSELNHLNSVERSMITRFGEVCVNFLTMEISRSEKPVALTAQEFKLLRFFIKTPERVLSRAELLNEVWGYNNYPSTRTVDNHICKLRQKLEPTPDQPIHFLTVHGTGYKFVP
jgi:hypothetical protein